ncbi:MAG: aldo/keto reductase [Bryobacterales bacterium]|nr:aldo/keto reductase [Bryobacterales bacterium]
MVQDFEHASLGKISNRVHRLGLAASYWPGKKTIYKALDEGVNYFFYFGFDMQMVKVLRDALPRDREKYVVVTGAYNYIWTYQNLRRTLERRLRQLRTDYIDVFHFLGVMKPKEFTDRARDELAQLRADSRVRGVAMSCHDRRFAGQLAAQGALDALMIRYNAAHRGAEEEIFPHLENHHPGVVSYTATRWTFLLRRPRTWPKDGRIPTAGMCYRFVLSNPNVDVCLTAPRNVKELEENLAAVRQGPLPPEEMDFMRSFGDVVHREHKKFL